MTSQERDSVRSVAGDRTADRNAQRRRGSAVRVAVGIAVVVAVGCGGAFAWTIVGQEPRTAAEAPSAGERPVVVDDELLRRAGERLIGRCMRRHGFRYSEQPPAPPWARDFPYVVDDVAWARTYGYGNVRNRRDAGERDVNPAILEQLSPDRQRNWHRTLLGSGRRLTVDIPDKGRLSAADNGCNAEAHRILYGDLADWYRVRRIVDHFDIYVINEVTDDSRYRAGVVAWARCVSRRGYPTSSPRELRARIAEQAAELSPAQARAREIAAAETEASCAHSTGLTKTIRTLEQKYRPEIERRFARELEELKSFEQKAIPRARRILADS